MKSKKKKKKEYGTMNVDKNSGIIGDIPVLVLEILEEKPSLSRTMQHRINRKTLFSAGKV